MTRTTEHGVRMVMTMLVLALLGGCNSTPQKPPPPPKPPVVRAPEPPPPPAPSESSAPTPDQAAASDTYAAPSANAAEVEIEEVALDGSTQAATPEAGERSGGGGGGASTPPGGTDSRPPPATGGAVLNAGGDPGPSGPTMQIGAQTDEEQLAGLDEELNRQLNAFDERMRRARAAAASQREELARAGGSAGGAVDGAGYREQSGERGAGGSAERASGLGNTPDLSGSDVATSGQVARYAPPPGIADGADDDIVARQLREAASKESDPLLREKLWEEYRKYKAGL